MKKSSPFILNKVLAGFNDNAEEIVMQARRLGEVVFNWVADTLKKKHF